MKFLLWYLFEGSPKARVKNFARARHYRMEGEKKQRKVKRELEKLRKPEYDLGKAFDKLKESLFL